MAAQVADVAAWADLLRSPRPVLIHLNADTTWLLQLPYPPSATRRPRGRTRFNILIDPWLNGPQSDVAWWFSTQWHVVEPSVSTIADLNSILHELEPHAASSSSLVDVVAISHEFTDHCHRATLEELPASTPVFAADVAANLIRGWGHFDKVITSPELTPGVAWTRLTVGPLPPWLAIGRVVTAGNALYYHAATLVAFDVGSGAESVVYSPHGIASSDLQSLRASGVKTLALLHGLHDVRIWMTKQLNLGARNGIKAVAASGARYWVATHDEVKTGGGFIAPFLQRTKYTLGDAVEHEQQTMEKAPKYAFVELDSGEGLVLD